MTDETINLTIIDQEDTIRITVTEEPPIYVNFYEIAVPDPRVSEARDAAIEAKLQAEDAQDAAEEAAAEAAQAATDAVAGETTARQNADTALQANIDAEASARIAADALLIPLTQKASANGVASLDSAGKVPLAQLPSSIMEYQGVYNASTNSPSLSDYASGAAAGDNIGNVYRVTVAGSQDFGSGSISFVVGDYVILNSSGKWEKSDTTDAVASVNGQTGVVTVTVDSTAGSETDKSPSVAATKSLVTTHAGLTSSHGVSGNIVGTTDTQTLTNKTIVAANNTITTAASGVISATEINAVIAQIAAQLSASAVVPAGTVIANISTSAPTGFISAMNKSVGLSGADYNGTTYQALYDLMWAMAGLSTTAGDPFKISSAKGASASADWTAGKLITVDFQTNEVFLRAKGASRNLGSYQADEIKAHTHDLQGGTGGVANSSSKAAMVAGPPTADNNNDRWSGAKAQVNGSAMTGTETRPKNVALNYYIKY